MISYAWPMKSSRNGMFQERVPEKGSSKGKFSEGSKVPRKGSAERFQVGKMRWPEIGFLVLKKVVSGHLLKIGFCL